jgi:protein-disulfide isomerase
MRHQRPRAASGTAAAAAAAAQPASATGRPFATGRHRTTIAAFLVATGLLAAAMVPDAAAQQQAAGSRADAAAPLPERTKGSAAAPVTVYEMSDFQCPFCRRFAMETFPAIEREYIATGKVRWIFINFPITSIHPNAVAAAEMGLCAAKQKVFWPVHDLLYRHQQQWARLQDPTQFLLGLADSVKADRSAVLACLQSPATLAAVKADAEGAARSGAKSTPAFYIEGGLLTGAVPTGFFRRVLDSVYTVKASARTP